MNLAPMKELDIYGVFVPPLLVWATCSLVLVKACRTFLVRMEFYRSDAEKELFDLALFVIFTCLLSFFVR